MLRVARGAFLCHGRRHHTARREVRGKAAALTGLARDVERRLMAVKNMLDDGKTKTSAAGCARAAAVDAVKTFGQPRYVLGRDADAGVVDRKLRFVTANPVRRADGVMRFLALGLPPPTVTLPRAA